MTRSIRINYLLMTMLLFTGMMFAQKFSVSGKITADRNEPLIGATVVLIPGNYGAVSDKNGSYKIDNVPSGNYKARFSFVGYETKEVTVSVTTNTTLSAELVATTYLSREVVVEVNRAKERETPVAFSNIDSKHIEERIHGQDAPLLIKGTPGVFTYSTDGVGNGEAQIFVRGFSQNYVQVLINGIPTNDPESNAVYWSNWGSVSSNASSIQVQRGAGSSLYGAGSFGGSFNIVTEDAPSRPFYGANLTMGDPKNAMYGIRYNSGLVADQFAVALNVDRKIASGSRYSGRYEGLNYYTSVSYFPQANQSIKFVLHGAPQKHGYSFSNPSSYFKKYGYRANSAPFMTKRVVELLAANATTGEANYGLLDNKRELADDEFVNLSHNFFHKPQMELHYSLDIDENTQWNATAFYTVGRGGGSSINSGGTMYAFTGDTLTTNRYNDRGYIDDLAFANIYLANAFQRISYSLHQQMGLITNFSSKVGNFLNYTVGGEFRNWKADHPGHFTNLFGKTKITQTYAYSATTGTTTTYGTFGRSAYQGDIDGPSADIGFPSGWNLSSNDPQYRTQYRNYLGETPQITLFGQGNWKYEKLNVMTSIQYVWYKYKLTEYMPSENAIGRRLDSASAANLGLTAADKEGPRGEKFYMMDNATKANWYEFNLVRAERSRGFLQPKIGLNYNFNENYNMFVNFAHVERFVDLGVYYNQGRINNDAGDEKSDQFEVGAGYASTWLGLKVNGYYMSWKNKSARIQDQSMAGQPGYDRNGFRTELVGSSQNIGIEVEAIAALDEFLPMKGLKVRGSFTTYKNTWTEILDNVQVDKNLGTLQEDTNLNGLLDAGEDQNNNNALNDNRRVFNTGGLDANGKRDYVYFAELKDKRVASGPQMMASFGLSYSYENVFTNLDLNFYGQNFLLDGESYLETDGQWSKLANGKEIYKRSYNNRLNDATVLDFAIGYNYKIPVSSEWAVRGTASFQVINLLDNQYFITADRFGVIPGSLRAVRFNLNVGL